jgi:hypothetical protein
VRGSWDRQVFFRRSRSEGNRHLHVLNFQGRKSGENFFDGIASRQAGQHCPKRNPSAAKNRLAAANCSVPYDPVFLFHEQISFPKLLGRLLNEHHTIGIGADGVTSIKMRFGLEDGSEHTLEEVGQSFAVTRERIRQIEGKALRKLRHPSRSRKLRAFMDGVRD